jgi:oligopeptide transport system ATP-binding protein
LRWVSALDVSIAAQIINLLIRLQREFNLSLLLISHDLSLVRQISHRVPPLYLGRTMEIASRDELYAAPRHPYTQALISAVPIPDPDRQTMKPPVLLTGDLPSPFEPPSGCLFRTRCPTATALCAATAARRRQRKPPRVLLSLARTTGNGETDGDASLLTVATYSSRPRR